MPLSTRQHPVVAAAERVIEAHEKVSLSARDWEVFYDAPIRPPEPNEKPKRAARRYRERFAERVCALPLETFEAWALARPAPCLTIRPANP